MAPAARAAGPPWSALRSISRALISLMSWRSLEQGRGQHARDPAVRPRARVPPGPADSGRRRRCRAARTSGGRSSTSIIPRCLSTTTELSTLRSSRTLPGQSCCAAGPAPRPAQPAHVQAVLAVLLLQEVVGQDRDVLLAVAQRRRLDDHHPQPVVEVLPETPARHVVGQVAVGGGDQADVAAAGCPCRRPG